MQDDFSTSCGKKQKACRAPRLLFDSLIPPAWNAPFRTVASKTNFVFCFFSLSLFYSLIQQLLFIVQFNINFLFDFLTFNSFSFQTLVNCFVDSLWNFGNDVCNELEFIISREKFGMNHLKVYSKREQTKLYVTRVEQCKPETVNSIILIWISEWVLKIVLQFAGCCFNLVSVYLKVCYQNYKFVFLWNWK